MKIVMSVLVLLNANLGRAGTAALSPCVNFSGNYKGTCTAENVRYPKLLNVFQSEMGDWGANSEPFCYYFNSAMATDENPINISSVESEYYQRGIAYEAKAGNKSSKTVTRWNDTKTQFAIEKTELIKTPMDRDVTTVYIKTFKFSNGHLLVSETRPKGGFGVDMDCDFVRSETLANPK